MPRFPIALIAAVSAFSIHGLASAQGAPALAPYAASFKGDKGLTIVVAPTADDKSALVRLKGLNNPVDGVVFLADKVTEGKRVSLRTTFDGRPWNMVISEDFDSWGGSYQRTVAYLPAVRDGVPIFYEEKASKGLDLKGLVKTYEKQKSDGVQEKLARFDRARFVSSTESRLKAVDDKASKACGVPVSTKVNWDSLKEDQLKNLSIAGYCSTMAEAVGQTCQQEASFKGKAAKYAAITCQFGDKLNLNQQGERTVFTTVEGAPNQDDFARQYLRNQ
ncbi:hypothetical protein [Diaphorobacter caeni]|uniref:hypothetical protein n=1 Tax=Diaphorobacter caeni TaxID=2784387 RepID=UPI00188FDE78|nr:hypothetical protein [Diaphorobacter caeni]MBF5005247.1 hypothetical protein [Diaphorobacter caeni]